MLNAMKIAQGQTRNNKKCFTCTRQKISDMKAVRNDKDNLSTGRIDVAKSKNKLFHYLQSQEWMDGKNRYIFCKGEGKYRVMSEHGSRN